MDEISDSPEITSTFSTTLSQKNRKRHRIGDMIIPEDKITDKILNVFKINAFNDELEKQVKNRY